MSNISDKDDLFILKSYPENVSILQKVCKLKRKKKLFDTLYITVILRMKVRLASDFTEQTL